MKSHWKLSTALAAGMTMLAGAGRRSNDSIFRISAPAPSTNGLSARLFRSSGQRSTLPAARPELLFRRGAEPLAGAGSVEEGIDGLGRPVGCRHEAVGGALAGRDPVFGWGLVRADGC